MDNSDYKEADSYYEDLEKHKLILCQLEEEEFLLLEEEEKKRIQKEYDDSIEDEEDYDDDWEDSSYKTNWSNYNDNLDMDQQGEDFWNQF